MNPNVQLIKTEILSDNYYTLKKVTFDYTQSNGATEAVSREAYDRGNGAAILLYNTEKKNVILTRQFRLPTYINGNDDGMLVEVCAGMLDEANPEDTIRREALEETGYQIREVKKIFEAYTSPGAVTEIMHFFIAPYSDEMKAGKGGGLDQENEDIEVMELGIEQAMQWIEEGCIKDAKTILLLQYVKLHGFL